MLIYQIATIHHQLVSIVHTHISSKFISMIMLQANPPELHSNLLYIQRYRSQSRLVSEAAYFFTNMLSAESFIMNIDAKSLSMEESEFEKNMEFAQALLFGPSSDSYDMPSQSNQSVGLKQEAINPSEHRSTAVRTRVPPQSSETNSRGEESHPKDPYSVNKVPSIGDLENRGATMLLKDENAKHAFQDFPYLYAQAGDLTISDIEELLSNYKQLVLKYVCLSKGVGISSSAPSSSVSRSQTGEHIDTSKEPEYTKAMDSTEGSSSISQRQMDDHVETLKELEDTKQVESIEEKHEDLSKADDSSGGAPKLGLEISESKPAQDEVVAPSGETDENP